MSGSYEVLLSATAHRNLDRLPVAVASAVLELVFGDLAAQPHRLGKRLGGDYEGQWSARRGQYRVVYDIDDEKRVVRVVAVGHRRDVYRRR
ncbi:MAG: type II toxin-antitoxin system RelE/ParE family toxin [Actinomycetota bacterium]|nr:type II toxin-antitoxin system RelE/ParE family toxin [Actinomycetota bacterium]